MPEITYVTSSGQATRSFKPAVALTMFTRKTVTLRAPLRWNSGGSVPPATPAIPAPSSPFPRSESDALNYEVLQ